MADDFEIKGELIDALANVRVPGSDESILDAHVLETVEFSEGTAEVRLSFPEGFTREQRWDLEDAVNEAALAIEGVDKANVVGFNAGYDPEKARAAREAAEAADAAPAAQAAPQAAPAQAPTPAATPDALQGVGRVIAVASGKGGVGKSTVAVNLALALKRLGFNVGLLDIDVYGPSVPTLLGVNERPNVEDQRILPIETEGLKLMSLGFLMDDDTPVIWRGPIVTGIIRQFLQDVDWQGVDYLIVDMPPGTGDAQLSLAQTVPVDGAVVVTTPSDLSLIDAARGLQMFKTLNVDVIGIVENMSYFEWPGAAAVRGALDALPAGEARDTVAEALEAHERMYIFGQGGGRREAERLETEFLGEIPLDGRVRAGGDAGRPIVAADADSSVTQAFLGLAERVVEAKPLDGDGGKKKGMFSFLKK